MSILKDLLNEAVKSEIVSEALLNLAPLKLGTLKNALKQTYYTGGAVRSGKYENPEMASSVANKNQRQYAGMVGAGSKIVEFGKLTNWGQLKKALNKNPEVMAVSLSTVEGGKSFALAFLNSDFVGKSNFHTGLAFDLNATGMSKEEKSEIVNSLHLSYGRRRYSSGETFRSKTGSAASKVDKESVYSYQKNKKLGRPDSVTRDFTDYEDWHDAVVAAKGQIVANGDVKKAMNGRSEIGSWDKTKKKGTVTANVTYSYNDQVTTSYGKSEDFVGAATDMSNVRAFIEKMMASGDVYAYGITRDLEATTWKSPNSGAKPRDAGLFADDLATRLKKYKNSKVETALDASVVIKKFINGEKKVTFNGKTWSLVEEDWKSPEFDKIGDAAFKGKPFNVTFKEASPGYGRITITLKLVNGELTVVKSS